MYVKTKSLRKMLALEDKGSPLRGSVPGPGQAAGRLHPGGYVLGPKAQYPLLVIGKSSSPPAGVEPGSMAIGPQGSNQLS
ncbi:hypothetical protein F2Q70_00042591 [Brassica cretica]|uniref:Uncharacterized protein n=1 Tax=Brassica cretica TaxID=69181 RepID=A0A8S9KHP0_BRACR|nr:hypothetical protein F2Q70_00042591 [Brassica cretica]